MEDARDFERVSFHLRISRAEPQPSEKKNVQFHFSYLALYFNFLGIKNERV